MELIELAVRHWSKMLFGDDRPSSIVERLTDQTQELVEAIADGADRQDAGEMIGDLGLLMIALADSYGFRLESLMQGRFVIRHRDWAEVAPESGR